MSMTSAVSDATSAVSETSGNLMGKVTEQFSKIKQQFSSMPDEIGRVEQAAADKVRTKSLLKGALAGLVGGLAATAAKSIAEKVYPPRVHGEPEPSEVAAERVAGHSLDPDTKAAAGQAIHWAFGALTGAAYGALAEYYPVATAREGAAYGMVLCGLTHEGAMPALGLSAAPQAQQAREQSTEMATHVVYGTVTETVRKFVRRML